MRIGGVIDGYDLDLETRGNSVCGRCGGPVIGFEVNIEIADNQVTGRLGGDVIGMDVAGYVENVDPIIAGAIFAITYYIYQVNHRNSGSHGNTGNN